jgi:hypothetical protein
MLKAKQKLPKPSRFSIERRKSVYGRLMRRFEDLLQRDGEQPIVREDLVPIFREVVPGVSNYRFDDAERFASSMASTALAYGPMDAVRARFIAERIAGSCSASRLLRTPSFDVASAEDGWCGLRAIQSYRGSIKGAEVILHCDILDGPWAGYRFVWKMSSKFTYLVAQHIGCSRSFSAKHLKYHGPGDLVGLYFMAYIGYPTDESNSTDLGAPKVIQLHIPPSRLSDNRKILGQRSKPCPRELRCLCHKCDNGLDVCKYAMHARTYHVEDCVNCRRLMSHDPFEGVVCRACAHSRRKAKEQQHHG